MHFTATRLLTEDYSAAPVLRTQEDQHRDASHAIWIHSRLYRDLHHKSGNVEAQATCLMADSRWIGHQRMGRRHGLAPRHFECHVRIRRY